MQNRSLALSLSRPLIAAAGFAAAGAAHANVYASYSNSSNFYWRVTGMTDLDQRRSSNGGSRPGLPNNGAMYCGPTATLNVACYVANHGYPFVMPGAANYQSNGMTLYNTVTSTLATLGVIMGTDPSTPNGGTGGAGIVSGNQLWFNGNFFDLVRKSSQDFYSPTVNEIGLMGVQGGLTHFAYGRWDYHSSGGNLHLDSREGGHVCTANRVDVAGSSILFKYRDPADDSANSSQSTFTNKVMYPTNRIFFRNGLPRVMSDLNVNANDGLKRIVDSTTTIFPRYGLTNVSGEDGSVGAQSLRVIQPQPLLPLVGPHVKTFTLPAGLGEILDLATSPDRLHYLILADDGATGFPSGLYRVDPFDGAVTHLLPVTNPRRMAFSRFPNELFIGETRTLHRVNLATTPPTIVQQAQVAAGLAIDALAYHNRSDEVYVLSGFDDQILRYQRTQIGVEPPVVENLPAGAQFLGGQMHMAIDMDGYGVMLGCSTSTTIASLTRVTDAITFQSSFTVPTPPRGLHLDDTGQAVVLGDGSVRTFRVGQGPSGAPQWTEQTTPWTGVSVGSILHITRSVNDDTGEHNGPGYHNLEAAQIVGGEDSPECLGDSNADDAVNFLDLNNVLSDYGLLGMWREGDVNKDGVCDFTDLNLVLSNYGENCPAS